MDYELLAGELNVTNSEAEVIMQDFITEVKNSWLSNIPFVYDDLLVNSLPLKSFTSQYVLDLVDGKTTAEEYTSDITDVRKANFAKIISFILNNASRKPFNIEDLGVFYLFGKLGRTITNPQTSEQESIPVSINLGFNPSF